MSAPARLPQPLPQPPRELSVFINGPYDNDFRQRFLAIVFAVLCKGMVPRSPIELEGKNARMDRIMGTLRGSKYSIHDLSRFEGEGPQKLSRFNMPFELGLATAEGLAKKVKHGDHSWAVLMPLDCPYAKVISDLGGHDPEDYDGTPAGAAKAVLNWLSKHARMDVEPDPDKVIAALPEYLVEAERLRKSLTSTANGWPAWHLLLKAGLEIAKDQGVIPG